MHNVLKVFLVLLAPSAVIAQTKENWVSKPISEWPRIALINKVRYHNGDSYVDPSYRYAGTGFLIDNGKDTLAATAKHILWIAKNRKTKAVVVNSELAGWTMASKDSPRDSAIIGRLINEDASEILEGKASTILERDWIIFSVKQANPNIYPLKIRRTPITEKEKVYILSCAYDDPFCTVDQGRVLRKNGLDILIKRDMSHHKGGCSGSPVIDANGYLVGILSGSSSDSKTGLGVTVATSVEYLLDVIDHKPDVNKPKADYGNLILQTALDKGVVSAIDQYKALIKDPRNFYIYNLWSANRNGLRETGQALVEMGRPADAVIILQYNAKINSRFFGNYNALAKAQVMAGDNNGAIKSYRISIDRNPDKGNEAYAALEKLRYIF